MEVLTAAEMDRLAEANRPVVRLRDRWMLVDPALARKARERSLKPLTAIDALTAALTGTADVEGENVEVVSSGWLDTVCHQLAGPDSDSVPAAPANWPTRTRGLSWARRSRCRATIASQTAAL